MIGYNYLFFNINCKIYFFQNHFMTLYVLEDNNQVVSFENLCVDFKVYYLAVYATYNRAKRRIHWWQLYSFSNFLVDHQCVSDDFNIISNDSERCGGFPPNLFDIEDFNNMILNYHL